MSERTPVYRLFDADGVLLYIGMTARVSGRMREHSKSQPWWESVTRIELEWFPTAREAWAAERAAILAENPRHNVQRYPVNACRAAPPHLWAEVPPGLARAIKRGVRKVDQAKAARNGKVTATRDELSALIYEALCLGCPPSVIGHPVRLNRGQIIVLRNGHIRRNPQLPVPDRDYIRALRCSA